MAKIWILINLNVPPRALGFINAIHAFGAAHEIDKIIVANIAKEAKTNKKDDNASRAFFEFQRNTSGTNASTWVDSTMKGALFTMLFVLYFINSRYCCYLYLRKNIFLVVGWGSPCLIVTDICVLCIQLGCVF